MTIADDLPRDYHERAVQEERDSHEALVAINRRQTIFSEINAERARQLIKWGPQTHPDGTGPEYAADRDLYRALCDRQAINPETDTWLNILREETYESFAETDLVALRKELVQMLAVGVAWVEDIDARV